MSTAKKTLNVLSVLVEGEIEMFEMASEGRWITRDFEVTQDCVLCEAGVGMLFFLIPFAVCSSPSPLFLAFPYFHCSEQLLKRRLRTCLDHFLLWDLMQSPGCKRILVLLEPSKCVYGRESLM